MDAEINYRYSGSLSRKNGYVYCEDVCLSALQSQLAESYKNKPGASPLFVYSKQQIISNVDAYSNSFGTIGVPYMIGYSLKANYNPHLLDLVTTRPQTAVVAVSGHEVQLAVDQGVTADRIIFNGNGKQDWELTTAAELDCLINVDSAFDVRRLMGKCEETGRQKPLRVLLRLNPDINPEVHPYLATGLAKSKFGVDRTMLPEVLELLRQGSSYLSLVGLHCHLGSTIENPIVYSESLEVMLEEANRLRQQGFNDLKYINLGGGLGINYRQHELRTRDPKHDVAPSVEEMRKRLHKFRESVDGCLLKRDPQTASKISHLVEQLADSRRAGDSDPEVNVTTICEVLQGQTSLLRSLQALLPHARIQVPMPSAGDLADVIAGQLRTAASDWPGLSVIVEPGRSIVGNAGTFLTKILGWKQNADKRYIVVDGSMTEVIRPALYGSYHHIELTEPTQRHDKALFDVVGPVCECGDFIGKDRWLSFPHEGCGLAVFDTGAYCASMASNYNMRPRPLEVLVDGSAWTIIRQPETLQNVVDTFWTGSTPTTADHFALGRPVV